MLKGLIVFMVLISSFVAFSTQTKVITIGNSFADSVFVYLPRIAQEAGLELLIERANLPGCSLQRHWELAERSEKDPQFKPYGKRSLKEILSSQEWDVVTLQQSSGFSWQENSYEPYLSNLIGYIKRYAPGAEIVMQQTWSYRFDEPRLAQWGISSGEMYLKLADAYNSVAKNHLLRQIPTGYAIELARAAQNPKFVEFDVATLNSLVYPAALPDQSGSLVNGIWWGKSENGSMELKRDSYHLNRRGQYLQACLWFAFIFDRSRLDITWIPEELDVSDGEFLQEQAKRAIEKFPQIK